VKRERTNAEENELKDENETNVKMNEKNEQTNGKRNDEMIVGRKRE